MEGKAVVIPKTVSNLTEHAIIAANEDSLNSKVVAQRNVTLKIGAEQYGIGIMDNQIRRYEARYNYYLTNVSKFISVLRSGSTIVLEGIEVLVALRDLKTAINHNPQGLSASIPMTSLYIEIGVEFLRTYNIMGKIIAKGGPGNMHTTAERTMMLWDLSHNLHVLRSKIHNLAFLVGVTSYEDLWNRAIAGKMNKTNKVLAKEAMKRFQKGIAFSKVLFDEQRKHHKRNPFDFVDELWKKDN